MGNRFTVFDGKMMLVLEEAEEGGFVVSSPLDPGLWTQAETLQEAFRMAYDAAECLAIGRSKLAEQLGQAKLAGPPVEGGGNTSETAGESRSPKRGPRKKSGRA